MENEDSKNTADPQAQAEGENDDSEENLDADQQKAFESIMAQIEGGDESGDGDNAPPAATDKSVEEDDFSAELEMVVQEANAADSVTATDESSDEDLDTDQQKAFESIMAQIEGDDDSGDGKDDPVAATDEVAEEEDFSAELEMVVQEANAADDVTVTDESNDENLDADQQKAFESIMAQIEGDDDSGDGDDQPVAAMDEVVEEQDFSAELEMVVQETNALDNPPPDRQDDDVDAQDGNGSVSDEASPEPVEKTPSVPVGSDPSGAEEKKAPGVSSNVPATGDDDQVNDSAEDISDEIGDLLDSISVEEDDSTDLEPVVDPGPKPSHDQTTESSAENHAPIDQPVDNPVEAPVPEPTSSSKEPDKPKNTDRSAHSVPPPATTKAKPLREAATPKTNKKTVLSLLVLCFIGVGVAGYYYWTQVYKAAPQIAQPSTAPQTAEVAVEATPPAASPEPVNLDFGASDVARLKASGEALDHLRDELIAKQAEIEELRAYYRAGIDAEAQGIIDAVRETGQAKMKYEDAMGNPRIRLGLTAIQRRSAYVAKLKTPVDTLDRHGEELLFLSRKAGLLALMAAKTSDIEVDAFVGQADETMAAHRLSMDQLNIDAVDASPPALAAIWKDIGKRLVGKTVKPAKKQVVAKTNNQLVWDQICAGDFSAKDRLTALSPAAARCLAAWKGKDLFLNGLTDLPVETARHLADWEGDWLGLNGLAELSPEAATHLSRWNGKGLSLNGLSRLSPRVVAILSEWQGQQIELINVKHMAHWENPNTRLFLSEAMNRKRTTPRN